MKIIDTHQHLWDLDLLRYSWLKSYPSLNRSFRLSDYRAAGGRAMEGTVFVECDVDDDYVDDEAQLILRWAEDPRNRIAGIIAATRPESQGFRKHVEVLARQPKVKGIRRVLHTQLDTLSSKHEFISNIRSLGTYGLSFDLCVLARQLSVAIDLVSKCLDVTFILDHCGTPSLRERVLDPWRSDIHTIAQFPNVSCKVSGLVAYADPRNWTIEDLRPYVEHVIESFGWDRVMFGSDWPVCTLSSSFEEWLEALESLTRFAGEENQRKLFYDNAVRIYRLHLLENVP